MGKGVGWGEEEGLQAHFSYFHFHIELIARGNADFKSALLSGEEDQWVSEISDPGIQDRFERRAFPKFALQPVCSGIHRLANLWERDMPKTIWNGRAIGGGGIAFVGEELCFRSEDVQDSSLAFWAVRQYVHGGDGEVGFGKLKQERKGILPSTYL